MASSPADPVPARRFTELDGMRGLLAVLVMLYHLGLNSQLARMTGGWLQASQWQLCVDFFFVLSGFVLIHTGRQSNLSVLSFAQRRWWRLAPSLAVCTLAVWALAPQAWPWTTVLANLLLIAPMLGLPLLNSPGWSISYEFVLPVLALWAWPRLPWLARLPTAGVLALLLAVQASVMLGLATGQPWAGSDLLRASVGLLLGAALYRHWQHTPRSPHTTRSTLALVACVAVMALAGVAPWAAVLFPPGCAAALWWGTGASGLFSRAPLQWLGRHAYAIYLTHVPVLMAAIAAMGEPATRGVAPKLALIAVTFVVAALLHRMVEAPLMRGAGRR